MNPEQIIAQLAMELSRIANARDRALAQVSYLEAKIKELESKDSKQLDEELMTELRT